MSDRQPASLAERLAKREPRPAPMPEWIRRQRAGELVPKDLTRAA